MTLDINPITASDLTVDGYLQDLVLDSPDVEAFAAELARFTSATFSSVGGPVLCGVTLFRRKKPLTLASSDNRAKAMDELQNTFGEGPCLTAMKHMSSVLVPDLREERRWPDYVAAASNHGIRSILGVPLAVEGETRAALNLYSPKPHGFSGEDISRVEYFASHASKSLRLALRIAQLSDTRDNMAAAMRSRTVIDLAAGAIMAQNRCSQETAMRIMTAASNHRNMKLRDVAASIVNDIARAPVATHFDA
jgi:GAF domain-containing protein